MLIPLIEIYISNRCRCVGEVVGDADGLEERRNNEVHVLAWIGKEADHAKEREGCHGAGVVVAGKTCMGVIEAGWDVYGG